jgi:hypothetical protein
MHQISRVSGMEFVNWQEGAVPGIFALRGHQTIGRAPNAQEKGFYGGCPGTGPRTGTGDGQIDAHILPFEQEKGPH